MPSFTYQDELYHHGILGMRWGVRRWQNEDGSLTPEGKKHYGYGDSDNRRIIPKGTVIYRSSVNKKEGNSGHAYVSISQNDRNHYRGGEGAQWLRSQSGNSNAKLYEHKYKLKEDLKVASKEDIMDVINNLSKEEKKIIDNASKEAYKETNLKFYKNSFDAEDYYEKLYESSLHKLYKKTGKNIGDLSLEEAQKLFDKIDKKNEDHLKKVSNELIKEYSKLSLEDAFELGTARSFGGNDEARNIVVKKLQEKGFNAMIDQAGIGTSSKNQNTYNSVYGKTQIIEGESPTIVFDRSIMESKGDHEIKRSESSRANANYSEWVSKQHRLRE